jgi:hypothetical protein
MVATVSFDPTPMGAIGGGDGVDGADLRIGPGEVELRGGYECECVCDRQWCSLRETIINHHHHRLYIGIVCTRYVPLLSLFG